MLRPIASRYHVTLMVNKGYSSASAMYESAQRMIAAGNNEVHHVCAHCTCTEARQDDEGVERCDDCSKR